MEKVKRPIHNSHNIKYTMYEYVKTLRNTVRNYTVKGNLVFFVYFRVL